MKTVICNSCGNRVSEKHVNTNGVCTPCIAKEHASATLSDALKSQMKICKKCGLQKPKIEFYANTRHKDGLQSHCKSCHKAYSKANHAAKKEKLNELEVIKQSGGKVTSEIPVSLRDYQIKFDANGHVAGVYRVAKSAAAKSELQSANMPPQPKGRKLRTKMTKKERRFLTHCSYLAVISCLSVYILFQL